MKSINKKRNEKETKAKYIEGKLRLSMKGVGYVLIEESKESIEIDSHSLNTGLHGDTVRVHLLPKDIKLERKLLTGEVTEILKRAKTGFAGVLEKKEEIYYLIPADLKMYTDIVIPENKLKGAKIGQKVFGTITKWEDPKKPPIGEIKQVLGQPRENDAEMKAIALERGFEHGFPAHIEKEAEQILGAAEHEFSHKEETVKRRDFRDRITFTIDPEDAKDFDDALSVKYISLNEVEIGIHIADVTHYVKRGGAIDSEAHQRGTSVYMVDRTISMLPEVLSNFLCSLRPHEDRLTFSAVFSITLDGEIKSKWFGKTIIHSHKRFTYEEAQKILNEKRGKYYKELSTLDTIAKQLRKKRFTEGSISLEGKEVRFILNEEGVPIKIYKKEVIDSNRLIEEFMLLANKHIASYIAEKEKKRIFVYRVHEKPSKEKMDQLALFLRRLGYDVKMKGGVIPAQELNKLIKKLEGKEEKNTIQMAIIRSMTRALYSTKNIGHYGLAFPFYTHFTSPIRRYPDMVVHRLLYDYLRGKQINKEQWQEYEKISLECSVRERAAQEAEWASQKYKQVEYMSRRIGEYYDGIITNVVKWGIYAEEKETACEGMIKFKDIGDDFYIFDENEMAIVGRDTHKKYRIGDKIKIRVKNVDLDKKLIDYELV